MSLRSDLHDTILKNQETTYNKLSSKSKGLIKAIQKIEGGSMKDIFSDSLPSNYSKGGIIKKKKKLQEPRGRPPKENKRMLRGPEPKIIKKKGGKI